MTIGRTEDHVTPALRSSWSLVEGAGTVTGDQKGPEGTRQ
jgi:hypothetical protein